MAKLCPLFSGSSGNSYYISSGSTAILIDAGKNAKQLEIALKENDLDVNLIKAIFITHEHSDHINAIRVFATRYKLPVFLTYGASFKLKDKGILNDKFDYFFIKAGEQIPIGDMTITPFSTDHDCIESVGYTINTADNKKIGFATDLGYISDEVFNALSGCHTVVIESNHDIGMLECGSYPYELKRRILSNSGHLSNIACAKVLPKLAQSGTTRFMLAHLSRENNMPDIAYQTALSELTANNLEEDIDFILDVAPEFNYGEHMFIF